MKKIISCLFIMLLSINCAFAKKTDCTRYLTLEKCNTNKEKKAKVISQKEHCLKYNMKLGDEEVSAIVYGLGYIRFNCIKKQYITYICVLDKNGKPIWGQINPREN